MEKMPARRPRPGGTISCFLTNWTRECKVNIRQEDKEGNLIRQIPSERFLEINENISQMIGLFLDQRG